MQERRNEIKMSTRIGKQIPETMKFMIVLYRNGEYLPQSGLYFSSKPKAQQTCDYLNSLIPVNLRLTEVYEVETINKVRENMGYDD